ncbi:hypothetical protein EI534_17700 [Pseudomonas frederiksbergensis]|nr:hypothetical protein [Pseudomonas frederiksbergensis]
MVEQHHLAPAPGGGQRTHQPCGACANDHDFGRAQNGVLTQNLYSPTNQCGSGLARDGGLTDNIDVECTGLIAGKPAPTGKCAVLKGCARATSGL